MMKTTITKSLLADIFDKCYLNGIFNEAIITVVDKKLILPFIIPDLESLAGVIFYDGFNMENQEIPITEIGQLIKFISNFKTDINISIGFDEDLFKVMTLSDGKIEADLNLPDESVLPDLKKALKYKKKLATMVPNVEMELSEEFINEFLKIRKSFSNDEKHFYISQKDDNTLTFQIGNYQKIRFNHSALIRNNIEERMLFKLDHFTKILSNNKDIVCGTLKLTDVVCEMEIETKNNLKINYYLLKENEY